MAVMHPFSRAVYEVDESSRRDHLDGRACRPLRGDGSWLDGEVFDVDPQLCNWAGGVRSTACRANRR